jgi:hypothetical protein
MEVVITRMISMPMGQMNDLNIKNIGVQSVSIQFPEQFLRSRIKKYCSTTFSFHSGLEYPPKISLPVYAITVLLTIIKDKPCAPQHN